MKLISYVTALSAILGLCVDIAAACNGYVVNVEKASNCITGGIVELQNFNLTLDKDCNIAPSGCMVNKAFKTAEIHYKVVKLPLPPLEGDMDMCEMLKNNKNEDVSALLRVIGIQNHCPMKAAKICGDNRKLSIAKHKNQLTFAAGKINMKLDITHDNGKSCIEIVITVHKPGRRG